MNVETWTLLASALTGLASFFLAGLISTQAYRWNTLPEETLSHFERERRARLRQGNAGYRLFEGWIQRLAGWNARQLSEEQTKKINRDLKAAGTELPWLPGEFLACNQLLAAALSPLAIFAAAFLTKTLLFGTAIGVVAGIGLCYSLNLDIERRARKRLGHLKDRLPFAIDLMALMMEAGATFQECLEVAVAENAGHSLGDELGEVLREGNLGRTRRDALLDLQKRLPDQDVSEFVFAVIKGEELGTPLAVIFRSQADQMRLKHSQRQEKESAEAQVAIVFPGMIIMLACLLIMTAPFILRVVAEGGLGSLFQ